MYRYFLISLFALCLVPVTAGEDDKGSGDSDAPAVTQEQAESMMTECLAVSQTVTQQYESTEAAIQYVRRERLPSQDPWSYQTFHDDLQYYGAYGWYPEEWMLDEFDRLTLARPAEIDSSLTESPPWGQNLDREMEVASHHAEQGDLFFYSQQYTESYWHHHAAVRGTQAPYSDSLGYSGRNDDGSDPVLGIAPRLTLLLSEICTVQEQIDQLRYEMEMEFQMWFYYGY